MQAILDIAWKRQQYFQQHPEVLIQEDLEPPKVTENVTALDIPRPVQIVIMGGSLLAGTNCRKMIRDLGIRMTLSPKECAWGNRLGGILNQVFQMPLVEVTNIGVGGTNTATGTILLDYDLLPLAARNPDIVINGYSTSDMHAWTVAEAGHSNATLGDQMHTMVEAFYRNATLMRRQQSDCSEEEQRQRQQAQGEESPVPPLVVHLDDYLGNEQREIVATMEGSSSVQSLARYYGFPSMSYADVARDWVYGDTHEYWFSPEGWYNAKKKDAPMETEIHPQMRVHIIAAWVIAYNFLHMTTTFCSLEPWRRAAVPGLDGDNILHQSYEDTRQLLPQLPALRGENTPKGKPRVPPKSIPPLLTKSLSLENISEVWNQDAAAYLERSTVQPICLSANQLDVTKAYNDEKCPFAWVTRIRVLPLPQVPETEARSDATAEQAYWKAHSLHDFGESTNSWKFEAQNEKNGVVPKAGHGSELLLEIPPPLIANGTKINLEGGSPLVDRVTFSYMKSYGRKWHESTVRLGVLVPPEDTGCSFRRPNLRGTVPQQNDK